MSRTKTASIIDVFFSRLRATYIEFQHFSASADFQIFGW